MAEAGVTNPESLRLGCLWVKFAGSTCTFCLAAWIVAAPVPSSRATVMHTQGSRAGTILAAISKVGGYSVTAPINSL